MTDDDALQQVHAEFNAAAAVYPLLRTSEGQARILREIRDEPELSLIDACIRVFTMTPSVETLERWYRL